MSDSQVYEPKTVSADGVTVTKRFEADEFPVPAIAFEFTCRRQEPVTVRLVDDVPEGVSVEDLGFHPEYGSEYWTIEADEITFERELESQTEYTTVYGIRATGTDDVEQFLTEPRLESVEPPLEDEELLVSEGATAVSEVITDDPESATGLDTDEEDVETLDLADPGEGQRSGEPDGPGSPVTGGTDDGSTGDVHPAAEGSLVAALAEELREEEVSSEDVEVLKRALDLAEEPHGPTEARIEKLQSDVDEVLAYTGALEEFLAENGTGEQLLDEFEQEVSSFREEVESVDERLTDVDGTVEAQAEQVEELAAGLGDVEEEMDDLESRIADFEDEVESRIATLETDLEAIEESVTEEDVAARIDDIDDQITELQDWRDQLTSVMGGGD